MVEEEYPTEPSIGPYQKFLREHLKMGYSMAKAAKLWKEQRGEGLEETEEILDAIDTKFGLERDLQKALRANIGQLESGLKITDGGKERETAAGRIDIKAEDNEGTIVVIELKAGTASPDSVAQTLAYMATISEEEKKPTRGILVAGDFHQRVVFASRAVPNFQLIKYAFQFSFEKVS
jgi:predicted RecB family endonuclease